MYSNHIQFHAHLYGMLSSPADKTLCRDYHQDPKWWSGSLGLGGRDTWRRHQPRPLTIVVWSFVLPTGNMP